MKSDSQISVLLYRHMFKQEREVHIVDKMSFRNIYKELDLVMPIEQYIFLDGDTIVENYATVPKNDQVYIKAIVAAEGGGGDFEEQGKQTMGAGGVLAAVGIGLAVLGLTLTTGVGGIGLLATIGISAGIGGLLTVGAGYWLYTQDLDDNSIGSSTRGSQQPSISGSTNSLRINQKVPILLGRHLVYPWYAALPYASYPDALIIDVNTGYDTWLNTNARYQYLNMLFGNTYANADFHDGSIKIGDDPWSTYTENDPNDALIDTQESSAVPLYYPQIIKQEDINLFIQRGVDTEPIKYTQTTAPNVTQVDLVFSFPTGLFYTNDGGADWDRVGLQIEWKGVNEPDSAYQNVVQGSPKIITYDRFNVKANTNTTCNFIVRKEFDNATPSDSEYNDLRQYTFRIWRVKLDDSDWSSRGLPGRTNSSVYLVSMQNYVGTFDDVNPPTTWPILPSDKEDLSITSLSIKATDVLNGTIDNLNYEMTAHMPVYSGTGTGPSQWSYGPSRNPASAFMYALTNDNVNVDAVQTADLENRIDYESIEAWYTFCEDLDLECNAYLVNDTTVEDLLKNICSTGFASWNVIDNKYTIYIDTYNSSVTQLFTPRNSFDYKGSKAFNDNPTGIRVTFVNSLLEATTDIDDSSDGGFVQEVRYVYTIDRADENPLDTDIINDVTIFGACSPDQAYRMGKYLLACTQLRPETHQFNVDVEHVMCTRWDRIKLQHDVPLLGLSSGRVISVIESAGDTLGFVSDEIIQFEAGNSYGVSIRFSDGTIASYSVDNTEDDTRTILFTTPLTGTGLIEVDDLFAFGEEGTETLDLIITNIEAMGDESATITCVDYNEAIYDAYTIPGTSIPDYVSTVSNGGTGTGGISINELPSSQEGVVESNENIVTASDKVDYRVSAETTTGYSITTEAGFYPDILVRDNTADSVAWVNYDQGNNIYTSFVSASATSTQLNSVSSKFPKYYKSTDMLYLNVEDNGGSLYLKDADTLTDGSKIYDGTFYDYAVNPEDDNIFIFDDTSVYELESTGYTLTNTFSASVLDLVVTDAEEVYYIKRSDGYVYKNTTAFDNEMLFFNGDTALQIEHASDIDTLYILQSSDLLIVKKVGSDTDTTTSVSIEFGIATASGFGLTDAGNIVYANTQADTLYYASESQVLFDPTLEAEAFTHTLDGDIALGSTVVTNVDTADLDIISVGDTVIGSGIPDDTYISTLGNSYFTMTQAATTTATSTELGVAGSRIILNANKVIVPGSIEARLLSASAINSKARDDNGDHISEFDLDAGDMTFRKQDGTKVLEFTPNPDPGQAELTLRGTLNAAKITGFTTEEAVASSYTVTVASSGGDYTSISSALEDISKSYTTFTDGGITVTIEVEEGFVITQSTNIQSINLNWVIVEFLGTGAIATSTEVSDTSVFTLSNSASSPIFKGNITRSGGYFTRFLEVADNSVAILASSVEVTSLSIVVEGNSSLMADALTVSYGNILIDGSTFNVVSSLEVNNYAGLYPLFLEESTFRIRKAFFIDCAFSVSASYSYGTITELTVQDATGVGAQLQNITGSTLRLSRYYRNTLPTTYDFSLNRGSVVAVGFNNSSHTANITFNTITDQGIFMSP